MGRPKSKRQLHMAFELPESNNFELEMLPDVSNESQSALQNVFQLESVQPLENSPQSSSHGPLGASSDLISGRIPDFEASTGNVTLDTDFFMFPPQLQNQEYLPETGFGDNPPVETRDDYLEKLSNLSASLLKHLRRMQTSDAEQTSGGSRSAESLMSCSDLSLITTSVATRPSYAVGELLQSTQRFLGILKHFLLSLASEKTITQLLPKDSTTQLMDAMDAESPSTSTEPSSQEPSLNLPTALAIFTCYISLIRVYRQVFSGIYHTVQTATTAGSTPTLPAILPNAHLDGFNLSSHRSLQITILTRVSMDLLGRIDRAVTALAGCRNTNDSVVAAVIGPTNDYSSLLETLVEQDAQHDRDGRIDADILKQGGVASLKSLVTKIHQSLNENMCLQLYEADIKT